MQSFDKLAALLPQCRKIVFSRPYDKDAPKLVIRAVGGAKFPYQACRTTQDKVFHVSVWDVAEYVRGVLPQYREIHLFGIDNYSVLLAKGNVISIKHLGAGAVAKPAEHNRQKRYLINEGDDLPIFIKLGIFTKEGKVVQSKQEKFRQVNRYLEMLMDVLDDHEGDSIEVVDFGCGKSYLSFAVYYYLTQKRGMRVHLVGVDRKADVMAECRSLAQEYGYDGMEFVTGDIRDYHPVGVDLVISLHACDVATDLVLAAAVQCGARHIFAAPCCHHEVAGQLTQDWQPLMLRHGIVRERMAALLTDSIRVAVLELAGYKVDIGEFVDLSDSPKNLLIRASRATHSEGYTRRVERELRELLHASGARPTLCQILDIPSNRD